MSGAFFILAINLSVAGLVAAVFAAIAVYETSRISARWFMLSHLLGMVYVLMEFALPVVAGDRIVDMVAYLSFLITLAAFNVGLAHLYDRPVPSRAIIAVLIGAIIVKLITDAMPWNAPSRLFLYQLPYAIMHFIGAWMVLGAGGKRLFDKALATLLVIGSLHYLLKPVIALQLGGVGPDAPSYIQTVYAMYSQSSSTVIVLSTSLLVMVILVRGLLSDVVARSLTDKLSGLMNRRGFEEQCETALRAKSQNGLPLSMVLCDLDHFKGINDTYGHATGDRVIVVFAELLREVVADHQIAARIGGEEFAILLPGANLAAARLFAENIRNAFASFEILGLPPDRRFTASFGVAECGHGETASELQARADQALYEAKRAGRDCVRTAPLRAAPSLKPGNGPSLKI